jgi:hypothetical protein
MSLYDIVLEDKTTQTGESCAIDEASSSTHRRRRHR